jgi:hypothetical protein
MKNVEALLDASKEIGLEVNSEKTKYMFMPRHQTAGQSSYIRVANKSFEKVAELKYLGAILTDQNCIHEEIRRLNSGNACYHAVQNPLSSRLLSRNVKIKIYKTIILPVALGGLVVSVLATGPKVRGFKPGRGRWSLRVKKSVARLLSEGK